MKLFRFSTLLALTMTVVSGSILFSTAQKVQQAESEVSRMNISVAQEEQTIRVLRAEWDYLNRPDRLEALVKNNLALVPLTPESVRGDSAQLPSVRLPVIPPRKPDFGFLTKAVPAAFHSTPAPEVPLQRPVAPESPRHDFQKLLNDLTPAAGEVTP